VANNLLTTQKITWETLAILSNTLKVWPNLYNGYDDEFGRPGEKIGQTLNVRKPQRYVGRQGSLFQPEALNNLVTPVTVNQQTGVDFQFSSAEKYLSLEAFSKQYLRPAAVRIANMLDFAAAQYMAQYTWNLVGTWGSQLADPGGFKTCLQASQKLWQNLADPEERCMVVNASSSVQLTDELKGLFNPQAQISKQYQKAMIGRDTGGMDWYQTENLASITSGAWTGTPTLNGANQTGAGGNNGSMALLTTGWGMNITNLLVTGQVFTIAGVFMTNTANYQTTSTLQQFVVQAPASSDGSGNATIQVAPAITISGQYQNVGAAGAINAAMTMADTASTASTQLLAFQRDSYTVVSVPGDVPGGTDMAYQETDPETGVTLRFVRDFDPVHDLWVCRFDVYWGIAPLYRELACRVAVN
jgi:P22 coat protein - gene protein 5